MKELTLAQTEEVTGGSAAVIVPVALQVYDAAKGAYNLADAISDLKKALS